MDYVQDNPKHIFTHCLQCHANCVTTVCTWRGWAKIQIKCANVKNCALSLWQSLNRVKSFEERFFSPAVIFSSSLNPDKTPIKCVYDTASDSEKIYS